MKYVKLGNSDLNVSRICLGCMGFGDATKGMHSWTLNYEQSKEIIKYALDHGINFFDTAPVYQSGSSEEYLGKAINELTTRDKVIIATKYMPLNQPSNVSIKDYITTNLNNSLKRLNTDYVDLYIMHAWDEITPIEETLKVLNDLIQEGKIRYIGISNCYAWQVAKANEIARLKGYSPFVSVQGHYNLIFREEEREMKPYCDLHNVSLTPYSALASGRLAKHANETSQRLEEDIYAKGKYDHTANQDRLIINEVENISQERNISMSEVSLAWLLTKVAAPIIGATKIKHLEDAIKAVNIQLSDEQIANLEKNYIPHELVGVMKRK